jgi:hypothetical protein
MAALERERVGNMRQQGRLDTGDQFGKALGNGLANVAGKARLRADAYKVDRK